VSGGVVAGGILAVILGAGGILFAVLYFLVGSIYTLFCTTVSYDLIRGSLAVARMKLWLKKSGLALMPVDSPS